MTAIHFICLFKWPWWSRPNRIAFLLNVPILMSIHIIELDFLPYGSVIRLGEADFSLLYDEPLCCVISFITVTEPPLFTNHKHSIFNLK
jgi:hypothetical protein